MARKRERARDEAFPLAKGSARFTTDLRFMARRRPGFRRSIEIYEFLGIDHGENQLWVLASTERGWEAAARSVDRLRIDRPAADRTDSIIVDLREPTIVDTSAPPGRRPDGS